MPLRQLYPDAAKSSKIDIIAVHGLNPRSKKGHAWDTWREPQSDEGRLWLRDDLPKFAPDARIFLYEYDSTAVYGTNRITFIDKANELLEAIRVKRAGHENRPLILMGHSLGGLLVEQALENAHNNLKYSKVKDSTTGLAFRGTPHNGGNKMLVNLGGIAAKIALGLGFMKGENIITTLESGSLFTDTLHEHWRHQLMKYNILSFWGSQDNIVPKESSRFGLPGDHEHIVKLDADHSGVCRFGKDLDSEDNLELVVSNVGDLYVQGIPAAPKQIVPIRQSNASWARKLNDSLRTDVKNALEAGDKALVELRALTKQAISTIMPLGFRNQISNMENDFLSFDTDFKEFSHRTLSQLRDQAINTTEEHTEIHGYIFLFERRTKLLEQFNAKKTDELELFSETIASLLRDGFENDMDRQCTATSTTALALAPRLLLSFGGPSISCQLHPLQIEMKALQLNGTVNSSQEDNEDEDEWFEIPQIQASLRQNCAILRHLRSSASSSVIFGVAAIDSAYRPGKRTKVKTAVGDIVLDYNGKLVIITGMLPTAPKAPIISVHAQIITVTWSHERNNLALNTIPTTGYIIRFRAQPNDRLNDTFFGAVENVDSSEVRVKDSQTTVDLEQAKGLPLFDGCD